MNTTANLIPSKLYNFHGKKARYVLLSGLNEINNDIPELRTSLRVNDTNGVRSYTHKLIGISQIIYQQSITSSIKKINQAAKEGMNKNLIDPWVDLLSEEVEEKLKLVQADKSKLRLIVYADSEDTLSKLNVPDCVSSIVHCKDARLLEKVMSEELPDIVFIVRSGEQETLDCLIPIIKSQFLGSEFHVVNHYDELVPFIKSLGEYARDTGLFNMN